MNIIKYGPLFFVLFLSISITIILINEKNNFFNNEIKELEKNYLKQNEERIKEEVNKIYKYIKIKKESSENLLKQRIKNRVYEAHQIATNIYLNESQEDHIHSKEHIFKTIKHALEGMIYNNGRGYIFIDNEKGTNLLQPLHKEIEGKNFYKYKNTKGYEFVNNIIRTIKNKTETFDSYYWYKNAKDKKVYKKISFYKYFEPFNVAIGTGEYIEDFEEELKKDILKFIQSIRYSKNGYIFMLDLKGNILSHYEKTFLYKNGLNKKNKDGVYTIKNILNFAKKYKEGFINYKSTIKPSLNLTSTNKISYIKTFEDWGWVIGTGFYFDDLNKNIEEAKKDLIASNNNIIKKIIIVSLLLTIIFIIISFYISKLISKMFITYENDLIKQTNNLIEKENLLVQQSKMATMGEMINNIAHQWKQPLSLISTSNGLLELNQKYNNFSQKEIEEAIEAINLSVKNLSHTIDDFRNFFNPEKELKSFSIRKSFEKTFKLIKSEFNNNNIQIIQNIEDIELYSYENELLQVLINILKNAKEELIKLEKDKKRVLLINTKKENNYLIIEIQDNANGINEKYINKVFDNHFTTKKDKGGSGIGLYMSKQIIEKSIKGKITVKNNYFSFENHNYKGACFIISLPIK
ncbi:cache domain-containing protein [Arcobacter sp. YIC-80]|uniref:sensor histidine kinase n=1 Tax=Arcobacter sp. YIC-80 TaxID=3376683 RepID=UPI00384B3000